MARRTVGRHWPARRTPRATHRTFNRCISSRLANRRDASKACQLRWTLCASGNYNPPAVEHACPPPAAAPRIAHGRGARRHAVGGLRRVLVGPAEAVSLAKPSKPAHEEKFALLIGVADAPRQRLLRQHRTRRGVRGGRSQCDGASSHGGSCDRCDDRSGRRSAAGASGQPVGAARQRDRPAAAPGRRSAANSSTASAATGSRAAARALRVRLELQIAGQDSSLLQVSNSRFLWVDRRLPTGRTVTRVDLRQLRADPVLSARRSRIDPSRARRAGRRSSRS